MRLIDADALDREMYRKSFEVDDGRNVWNSGLWIRYKIYEEAIRDAPTVDAVPVIRCKDCALWNDADSEHLVGYCTEGDGRLPSNGEKITFRNEWCCWAERKEE